jgi:hypothetical protein
LVSPVTTALVGTAPPAAGAVTVCVTVAVTLVAPDGVPVTV